MANNRDMVSRRDLLKLRWLRRSARSNEGNEQDIASSSGTTHTRIRVGNVEDLDRLQIGTILEDFKGTGHFYLARLREGLLALSARCTKDNCLVGWRAGDPSEDDIAQAGRFYCTCDASIFDRRGLPTAGPARRPLDYLPLSIREGGVWADMKTVIQREAVDLARQALSLI